MSFFLNRDDMEPLILGAAFFGSGGGGTLISARSLLSHFEKGDYYPTTEVEIVSVDEATEGEAVMGAYMGAPEAIDTAKYPLGPVSAVMAVQEQLQKKGKTLKYVVSPESGPLGFLVACLVAAKLDLKVLNADGAGRAVPSLPMLTYAAAEVSPRPSFLVSQNGLKVELNVTPRSGGNGGNKHQQDVSVIVEQMMRPIVGDPEFDQFGGLAMWVMDHPMMEKALPIRNTLTRAHKLGCALIEGRLSCVSELILYLRDECNIKAVTLVEDASITDAEVDTSGGFDVGKIHMQRKLEGDGAEQCTVVYQNETLIAWSNKSPQPLAIGPDSISYFVPLPGQQVFTNGDVVLEDGSINPIIKDRPVALIAWEADEPLREPGGLILDSFLDLLNKMGYMGSYVPVTQLHEWRSACAVKKGGR